MDNSKFEDTSSVLIKIDASDADGSIQLVEIFVNDSIKIAELCESPYEFNWIPSEFGNYNIHAVATDNSEHKRKSSNT